MAESVAIGCVLFSVVVWIVILVGMVIFRLMGKCPNACFNTKCKWRFFCGRFVTIAYNIEHAKQMLKDLEKKGEQTKEAEKSGDSV